MSLTTSDFQRSSASAINGSDTPTPWGTGGAAKGAGADSNSKQSPTEDGQVSGATLLAWFRDAARAQDEWRRNTIDALMMLNNKQWDAETLAQLPPTMAAIVINIMLSPILYISGVQRQTREEAKIVSASGGSATHAELMNALVHWVENHTVSDEIDSQVFLDKIVTGLGWWKYTMNYTTPDIEGNIDLCRRHALAIYPDPNFFDGRWQDAQYVFDTMWLSVSEACTRWPDYAEQFKTAPGEWLAPSTGTLGEGASSGDSFSDERLFWDPVSKKIRILEAWYKVTKTETIGVDLLHPEDPITDPAALAQLQAALQQDPSLQQQYALFRTPLTTVRVAHVFRDHVLDDDLTPCEQNPTAFPLFPSVGYYFWKTPFGMAELMKDLQREKNKRRSKLIELTGRMPLSGFFNKAADGADQRQLEDYATGNGAIITYKTVPPIKIPPPDLPMAVVRLEDAATAEVKTVTNVHDELLGQATQTTISGAAIEARQRGGFLSHELLFDTFRLERHARVKFLINMIQEYISPTKALRILGALAGQGNQQLDMMLQQAQQDPLAAQQILQLLSDAFDAEYDVVVTSKPTEPSLAMQAWEALAQLKEKGAEIPPKTLWEAAQKAGILSEAQVQEILGFIQQQQQQQQPGAAPGA